MDKATREDVHVKFHNKKAKKQRARRAGFEGTKQITFVVMATEKPGRYPVQLV